MTKVELLINLRSTKSVERRRAAKEIGKLRLTEFGNELYESYLTEKKDKRTWETQKEMIKSLGLINYTEALSDIETVVYQNAAHDMITMVAATSYVQLKRGSKNDAKCVIDLLNFGSVSVICGALFCLPFDRMTPSENQIEMLIEKSWDINKHPDRLDREFGLIDPRIYLALACADWNLALTEKFLNHCIQTAFNISRFNKQVVNTSLITVCENSLKNRFSKGYL